MKAQIRSIAQDDIIRQYRYYLMQEDAPATAERFLAQVHNAIKQVCKRPRIGKPKLLNNPKLLGLRSWAINGFPAIRVYYTVQDRGLLVIRVLHDKRDINPLLEGDDVEGL
ncbi:MAG TPA: type II toxin-antitoxin system RelE/ParE family toxin [Candidatus Angelobacter sp.]|jgi:toxin ParE1/3/4|nr:type II toxin-antitoxin system RelE/ParE family toxin [Candidatus Angelobacter sp.]